nr:ABC_choXWV_ATP: choline ABC transporter, ATP-binding protein [uncultured bacterium]
MGKVRDILRVKGTQVFSVAPDVSIFDAIAIMSDKNVGGLLITEGGSPIGIFTERDYARKVVLHGKNSKTTPLRYAMTSKLITVTSDYTVEDCMELMTVKKIRHLPVVDNGQVTGLISIGDVVRFVINEQREIIDQLEHYITGH